jgi:GR25 family glycosyltransferase involved in LPS biosynthesis
MLLMPNVGPCGRGRARWAILLVLLVLVVVAFVGSPAISNSVILFAESPGHVSTQENRTTEKPPGHVESRTATRKQSQSSLHAAEARPIHADVRSHHFPESPAPDRRAASHTGVQLQTHTSIQRPQSADIHASAGVESAALLRVVVIFLPQRLSFMQRQLESLNVSSAGGFNVTYLPAVTSMDDERVRGWEGYLAYKKIGIGHLPTLSHTLAMHVASLEAMPTVVLEDDVLLHRDFPLAVSALLRMRPVREQMSVQLGYLPRFDKLVSNTSFLREDSRVACVWAWDHPRRAEAAEAVVDACTIPDGARVFSVGYPPESNLVWGLQAYSVTPMHARAVWSSRFESARLRNNTEEFIFGASPHLFRVMPPLGIEGFRHFGSTVGHEESNGLIHDMLTRVVDAGDYYQPPGRAAINTHPAPGMPAQTAHLQLRLTYGPDAAFIELPLTEPPPLQRATAPRDVLPHVDLPSRHVSLPTWESDLEYALAPSGSTTSHYPYPADPTRVSGDASWLRTFNPSIAMWRRPGASADAPSSTELLVASRVGVSWPCDGNREFSAQGVGYYSFVGVSTFGGSGKVWIAAQHGKSQSREAGFQDPRLLVDEEMGRVLILAFQVEGRELDGVQWLMELSSALLAAALDESASSGRVVPLSPLAAPLRLVSLRFRESEKNYIPFAPLLTRTHILLARGISPVHDVVRCSRDTGVCTDVVPASTAATGVTRSAKLPLGLRGSTTPPMRGSTQAVLWGPGVLLAVGHVMVPATWFRHYYFFFYTFSAKGMCAAYVRAGCCGVVIRMHDFCIWC